MMHGLARDGDIEALVARTLQPPTAHARLSSRLRLAGCAAVGLALATGCAVYFGSAPQPSFAIANVSRGDLSLAVTTTGAIEAREQVEVGAEVSGLIRKVMVDFNTSVKRGQLLAVFDSTKYESEVAQSQAQLQVAQAGELLARATVLETAQERARQQRLLSFGWGSAQKAEQAQAGFGRATAELLASQARVHAARAALDVSLGQLAKTRVLSPVDGTILDRVVQPGQVVIAALQTPRLFTVVVDGQDLTLMASVSEADIASVSVGQVATFSVDGVTQPATLARVAQIRAMPRKIDGVVTYQVGLSMPERDLRLRPGMTAAVTIQTAQRHGVLKVANAALRFVPPGHRAEVQARPWTAQGTVWTRDEAGQPRAVALRLGLTDGHFTEVTGGDLHDGQAVLTGVAEAPSS